ncbi:MAG: hypothetical protein ACXW32_11775 [Limisphaerales bacterium]
MPAISNDAGEIVLATFAVDGGGKRLVARQDFVTRVDVPNFNASPEGVSRELRLRLFVSRIDPEDLNYFVVQS